MTDGAADESVRFTIDALHSWGHLVQKVASEDLIARHVRNGLDAVVVNPSMCVGEYDTKPSTGEFFRFFARSSFLLMPDSLLNIVDVEDVAAGTVLALEKGVAGERYILGGNNTTIGDLARRVRSLAEKPVPRAIIPRRAAILAAYFFEVLNLVVRASAPVIPLLGVELIEHGSQHFTSQKAEQAFGYRPRDAWPAVDRAFGWYRDNRMI